MPPVREFLRGAVRLHILHHAAGEELNGAWIAEELARHGYKISPGTLYPTLHRMEEEGLLSSRKELRSGRVVRLYLATELGRAILAEERELLAQGVRDMVRISDARMSGTAYGTVILHVAPEAAAGGPFARVRDGDVIRLDVKNRTLEIDVADDELARRTESRRSWDSYAAPSRGWEKLYVEHVMQADTRADLDFLVGSSGDEVTRESH